MKVLMILEREFPSDDRVEKEISSLVEAGFDVDIACFTFVNAPEVEKKENYTIYRKKISNKQYKLSAACLILPSYFKFWKKFISKLFENNQYGFIHIHDLPLTKVGLYFKKKYNIKLIADQHEYYSSWIVYTAHHNTFAGKIVKALSNWKKYENKYLSSADCVITVAEPLRDAYIENTEIKANKIIVVPNTPLKRTFNINNVNEKIVDEYKNSFVLFYAGGIDPLRGLDFIVKALPIIQQKVKNILFLLAGGIQGNYNLMGIAKQYKVENLVKFLGLVDVNYLPSYIAASDICVFTPPSNREEINKTIVTKMYQYAALHKPIIVSKVKMMTDFVENNKIGFSVDENNVSEFADLVIRLHNDKEIIEDIKSRSAQIKGNFFWEDTVTILQEKYKGLVK